MSTKSIDWSKAPEGATHVRMDDIKRPWRKLDKSGEWYAWSDGHWVMVIPDPGTVYTPCQPFGPSIPWDGEGLPPIGSVCEMLSHGEEESEWIEVQILAHTKINGEDHAVFQYEEHVGTGSVQGSCFRPVRTAQERGVDLALSEIEALYAEGGPAAIYDAGYRKVEGGAA